MKFPFKLKIGLVISLFSVAAACSSISFLNFRTKKILVGKIAEIIKNELKEDLEDLSKKLHNNYSNFIYSNKERLRSLLDRSASSASELLERIETNVFAHIDCAPKFDGLTMLAVRRTTPKEF